MTRNCWGPKQYESLIYILSTFTLNKIPTSDRHSCFLNQQIFTVNFQISQRRRMRNGSEGTTLSTSPQYRPEGHMWSACSFWLSELKFNLQSDLWSTKQGMQNPKRSEDPQKYEYMWRLLLCGGHMWLNFNWRAASQSYLHWQVHRWPTYCWFIEGDGHGEQGSFVCVVFTFNSINQVQ